MPINRAKQINLLPLDDFDSSIFGRVLKWALSSFRVMVIVTELVVMSAFLSRFWLDAKNSDISDSLNFTKSQVLALSSTETELRSYQKRLSVLKNLYNEPKSSDLILEITKNMPQDITLTSFQKNQDNIQIKAFALSEQSIAQFLVNLSNNKKFADIILSQVASSVDNSFVTTFTINAKYINN